MSEEASDFNPIPLSWSVIQDLKGLPILPMLQAPSSLPVSDQNVPVTYFVSILPGMRQASADVSSCACSFPSFLKGRASCPSFCTECLRRPPRAIHVYRPPALLGRIAPRQRRGSGLPHPLQWPSQPFPHPTALEHSPTEVVWHVCGLSTGGSPRTPGSSICAFATWTAVVELLSEQLCANSDPAGSR